jgi:Tol biopolymer transport system component
MSRMNGGQQIFSMNTDGTHIRQLTSEGDNGDPVWSPDGAQISFGSDREGNGKLNIFIMNADGSNTRQLTHFQSPIESGDTNWSSDGKKIIFEYDINGKLQSDPDAYAEVWTMNADGSGQTSTKQPCSDVGCAPRWQPH